VRWLSSTKAAPQATRPIRACNPTSSRSTLVTDCPRTYSKRGPQAMERPLASPRQSPRRQESWMRRMKEKRRVASARRFLASLATLGVLALVVPSTAPNVAWGRVAPLTTVSGDPDDPESPSPGPRKASQSATTATSNVVAPNAGSEGALICGGRSGVQSSSIDRIRKLS